MKSRLFLAVSTFVLGGLLLGACMPSTPTLPPHLPVTVGAPSIARNTIYIFGTPQVAPPGTQRTLHVQIYNSQYFDGDTTDHTGVSTVNVSYEGASIGSVSMDPSQPFSQGSLNWTPPSPAGEYSVQAATGAGGGAVPQSANVCVENLGVTIGDLEVDDGTTCLPPPPPPPPPSTSASFSIILTDVVTVATNCNYGATIQFNIYVNDPSNQIAYAYVDMNVASPSGDYQYGLPGPNSVYGIGVSFNPEGVRSQLSGSSTVTWTAHVVSYLGQILSDGPHQLTLFSGCILNVPNLPVTLAPPIRRYLPTLLPAAPLDALATATPASALDCPPATFFAELTHQCLPVQIPSSTPKPKNSNNNNDNTGTGGCPSGTSYVCTGKPLVCSCQ